MTKSEQKILICQFFINQGIPIDENIDLFESGAIDSMGIIELIAYLEKESAINIDASKMTADNFKTINAILNLLSSENG